MSFQSFGCDLKDLVEERELGRGAHGSVYRMRHAPSGITLAVKVRGQQVTTMVQVLCMQRIRATVEKDKQRRLRRELDVLMKSKSCPFITKFYGALFGDASPS